MNLITPTSGAPIVTALTAPPKTLHPARNDAPTGRIAPPARTAFHTDVALAVLDEATQRQARRDDRPLQVSFFVAEEPESTIVDELLEDAELLQSLSKALV